MGKTGADIDYIRLLVWLTCAETIPPRDGVGNESLKAGPVQSSGAPSELNSWFIYRVGGVVVKKRRRSDVEAPKARVRRALRTVGRHPQGGALREAQAVGEVQRPRRHLGRPRQDVVDPVGVGTLRTVAIARRPQGAT